MDSKYSYLYKKAREYCSYVYELYATHYKKKPVRYNCRWIDQSLYYSSQYIRAQEDFLEIVRRMSDGQR